MIKCLIFFILFFSSSRAYTLKPGNTFELQCPDGALNSLPTIRTFAIVLNIAQKNMEIYIYTQRTLPVQGNNKIKSQPSILQPYCILTRNNKICVFDGFVNQLNFQCNNEGTVSLLLLQPVFVPQATEITFIRQKMISPVLAEGERGIIKFKPDINIQVSAANLNQFFIANCIQSISYFQQQFLIGVKGGRLIQAIMASEGVTGIWKFKKVSTIIDEADHVLDSYSSQNEQVTFYIEGEKTNIYKNRNFYGFKFLVSSESQEQIRKLSINVTVLLKMQSLLFEEFNQTICIKEGQIQSKIPLKLSFFYSLHSIISITLSFNRPTHYSLQLSEPLEVENNLVAPVIEEDEYIFYSYKEGEIIEKIQLFAHIEKYYRSKTTPALDIKSAGIKNLSAALVEEGLYQSINKVNNLTESVDQGIRIKMNHIQPIQSATNDSFVQISLEIEPLYNSTKGKKNQKMSFFKLMLKTALTPIQIQIGKPANQFLFENEVKRFYIPKQKMELVKSKILKVICNQCQFFLTYNHQCSNINCCQYAHLSKIDVKASQLNIFVVSLMHSTDTALIKLHIFEDYGAYILNNGQIIQGLLPDSETFIFDVDGRQNIQIIFNSQAQSILMLATLTKNQFPNKNSFDFQSNEGYIFIPAPKMKKTIYIKLIRMISSMESIESLESLQKIPYSIVAVTESSKIQLVEGKKFTNIVKKTGVKQYVLKHMCNPQENIYLRIQSKSYSTSLSSNLYQNPYVLDVEVKVEPINYSFATKIDFSETIDITNMLKSKSIRDIDSLSICDFRVLIKNLANETLYINLLFFKQKQLDQITIGEFSQQHILSQNLLLYCIFDAEKDLNIYSYSLKEEIALSTMIVLVPGIQKLRFIYNQKEVISSKSSKTDHIFERIAKNYNFQVKQPLSSSNPSYSQYRHIPKVQKNEQARKMTGNITVLLLQIRRSSIDGGFQKNDIFVVCTHDKTKAILGSRVHYQIMHEAKHKFQFPISFEMLSGQPKTGKQKVNFNNEKQIILQTTKLDGRYFVEARMTYFGQVIGQIDVSKKEKISSTKSKQSKLSKEDQVFLSQESIIFIKVDQLKSVLTYFTKKNGEEKKGHLPVDLPSIQFSNLLLQFHITCSKKVGDYCSFLTSLQTSNSDIRQLTPGVPQIFHINKHSSIIFIYNNYKYDRQFKFKVNRKLGFPNYKLCSYRTPLQKQLGPNARKTTLQQESKSLDKCLSQLKNPENQLNLRIEDNAFDSDANNIVGRTHELIINQHNENYCTNCTYYLGLYSDYDVVEGSIFAMNGNQPTFLEQGNSITTIVYRGEPDTYIIANWKSLMGIIYQLEGEIQFEIYYYDKDMVKNQVLLKNEKRKEEKNRQLKSIIAINLIEEAKKYNLKQYYLSIKPLKNLPSALYTLVIMSKQEQIINIKDGVPYQMKYTPDFNGKSQQRKINPLIKYRYRCENQGIAMISSKNFDDLEIEIRCRDSIMNDPLVDPGSKKEGNQNENEDKTKYGELIDYLQQAKTGKSRQISNRVDINVSPKTCINYQIGITSKTPTVWYSILISSTDIITLPLNKQIAGLLKYQTKLYQIYEININERTQAKCVFKFCQAGQGRIMISKSKSNLFAEVYQQEVEISEDSTSQILRYTAKPGLFYIKVQFKASGGVLQYTLHVQNTNTNGKFYDASLNNFEPNPIEIYNNFSTIRYKVKRLGVDFTQYEIQFYPLKVSSDIYDVSYYLVQSTKLKLLKKTQNCNGQYFIELVNHHQEIIQTKVKFDQKSIDFSKTAYSYDSNKYKIRLNYSTKLYESFITIIPIVYNIKLHEFSHLYVPKYHQAQLTNGQIYSKITYLLNQIAYKIEQVVDIHGSQDLILLVIALLICLCFVVAVVGGVWIGRMYFFRVQTVYVLKQIKQQQNQDDQDNRIEDEIVSNNNTQTHLIRQQIGNEQQNEQQERGNGRDQSGQRQDRFLSEESKQAEKEEGKRDITEQENKYRQELRMEDSQKFQQL